jgi:hypothetical protein
LIDGGGAFIGGRQIGSRRGTFHAIIRETQNMATWPTITVNGSARWLVWGGSITNHEVFAFTLQSAASDVGAYISDVTVFNSTDYHQNGTNYFLNVQSMRFDPEAFTITPTNRPLVGNFESNGV